MKLFTSVHHSREAAFLAAAGRAFVNEETLEGPSADGALDWEWVLSRAETEGLAPILYSFLREHSVPAAILRRLRAAWISGRRQHLLGVEQLSRLSSAFEGGGVPLIPLKGPVLAEAHYRDPGLRPFTDLDLFIREEDLPRAVGLLSGLGYRHLDVGHSLPHELAWRHAAAFVSAERRADDLPVDLHWGLVDYPGLTPPAAMDYREIWDRAVPGDGWGRPRLELCPEDLLIYLALHWAVHHAFSGLIWQLDLALLLRRDGRAMDWERVIERAGRWRVSGALYVALQQIHERIGVDVSASVLSRLRPSPLRCSMLQWLCRWRHAERERLDYLFPLLVMDRGSDVFRALARNALPPGEWLRGRYGGHSVLRGYLAHYGRVGRTGVRSVRAILGRPR